MTAFVMVRKRTLRYVASGRRRGKAMTVNLAGELFSSMTGVKMIHVPYKDSSPGTVSVMAGETDLMFSNILPALPAIRSGRLRPLGLTSLKRVCRTD